MDRNIQVVLRGADARRNKTSQSDLVGQNVQKTWGESAHLVIYQVFFVES